MRVISCPVRVPADLIVSVDSCLTNSCLTANTSTTLSRDLPLVSPAAIPRAGEAERHRGGEAVPAQEAAGRPTMTLCVCDITAVLGLNWGQQFVTL